MKRRAFLLGAVGAAAGAAYLFRPTDHGGAHDPYFLGLSAQLREQRLARPVMVVDLDRVDHNIAELRKSVRDPVAYRVVAKSLPSPRLLEYITAKARSDRLMVFHQPFLNEIARRMPQSDVLIGKPFPVAAAARFYDEHRGHGFDPARQLQWLVDTPERVQQYANLARSRNLNLQVNVEIDVGLHRGGVTGGAGVAAMLQRIDAESNLRFAGFMGYDAHVSKVPTAMGLREREFSAVLARYREAVDTWRGMSAGADPAKLTLNAAGSPTFRLWEGREEANEMAAGSGLVMPLDFDIDTLASHLPALFIATPVLKASGPTQIPVAPAIGQVHAVWDPNRERTFFIYGGYWKARPVSPPGLVQNPIYGRSTNQEILNGSSRVELGVDDYVFYRPTQSEFVMLQFGDLAIVRDGRIVDFWPVLGQPA